MNVDIIFLIFLTLPCVDIISAQITIRRNAYSLKGCLRPEDKPMFDEPSVPVSGELDCVRRCLKLNKCGESSCQGVVTEAQNRNTMTCTTLRNFTGFPTIDDTNCHKSEYSLSVYERGIKCPAGWTYYGNHCYKYMAGLGRRTFFQARVDCQNEEAYLPKPESAAENIFLLTLAATGSGMWIGLNDLVQEGFFVWEDGCPLSDSLAFWKGGEPNNNDGIEHCAILWPNYLWNDGPCTSRAYVVCQRSPDAI